MTEPNTTAPTTPTSTYVPAPHPPGVCPGCGRCYHCGRGGYTPYMPYPWNNPTWTIGTGSDSNNITFTTMVT